MKFDQATKTPLGNAFAVNLASGDVMTPATADTPAKPKKDPEPAGAFVSLSFKHHHDVIISAAAAKELANWLTANAAKIVPAAP